jgi:hypothetical protein
LVPAIPDPSRDGLVSHDFSACHRAFDLVQLARAIRRRPFGDFTATNARRQAAQGC